MRGADEAVLARPLVGNWGPLLLLLLLVMSVSAYSIVVRSVLTHHGGGR